MELIDNSVYSKFISSSVLYSDSKCIDNYADFLVFWFFKKGEMLDVVKASNSSLWLPYPVLVYIWSSL